MRWRICWCIRGVTVGVSVVVFVGDVVGVFEGVLVSELVGRYRDW